ncbi:MAG: saccharopine dehydrogenase NADP-binding domain-containing protein [Acidimicrobiia bacterium]|nr:saccharopine dehydrogenase NADP-binding domain-containing protein [Acidimicrobiia bacterium]
MKHDPEFDIVVWGATGFTGRLAVEKLATRAQSLGDLRWAIGGRNKAKLEALRAGLGSAAADIPIITGDSHDVASMEALAARTSVVCSTVGPYALYGSELVGACVRAGTHYCDISAEPHWIRKMMDAYEAEAAETGARIVHACGMDSIPSDVGVHYLQQRAEQLYGKPCSRVKMRVTEMQGGFSGGTAASLLHGTEAGRTDPSIGQAMTEPYYLAPEGHRQGPDEPDNMRSTKVEYDEDVQAWTKPFFMGPMNSKIVRRTNALLGYPYGEDFSYNEARVVADGLSGRIKAKAEALGYVAFLSAVASPPTRSLLKKYVLPGSGEGPDQETRESGQWKVVLIGKTDDGTTVRTFVGGEGDPATDSTSRMLVESALCLAQDADKIPVGGGSWTPAAAMGDLLLDRLTTYAGMSFEFGPSSTDAGRS